jgi:hypothetical protein
MRGSMTPGAQPIGVYMDIERVLVDLSHDALAARYAQRPECPCAQVFHAHTKRWIYVS